MSTGVLDQVNGPADVKALEAEKLVLLASEIRREIVHTIAANGGHLATNLGTVELSIALHSAFDSPHDKIIWDVGNQCYTHKLLTGRRDRFKTIRKGGGLSGFVTREESPHDHLTAGHAGTALSSALGIATARDRVSEGYRVVAVVGDGAMTAGLSYEALNNLVALRSQLLLVLNDNEYAISPCCGGLAQSLKNARSRILDGTFFEQLGGTYIGPVDGHDLQLLIDVLHEAKQIDRPVILHVLTQKGRGYRPAEQDPESFHGVSPFDAQTGQPRSTSNGLTYSELFGRELMRLAEEDSRVMAVTAAMTVGTGLSEFADRWPERFFDVGIAEQHAVTFAAGLALGGCRPVVAIYSSFLQRGYDQVIHDVCLQDLPVTFVLDRGGIVGADGPTHHGIFDYGFLRMVPRMVVMAPKDGEEFGRMLRVGVEHEGPVAVRIPRGTAVAAGSNRWSAAEDALKSGPSAAHRLETGATVDRLETGATVEIGKGELLSEGSDVGLIAIGSMVARALQAARTLEDKGFSVAVVNARFVKPLDTALILATARQVKHLFTLEEHVAIGGFGSAVTELLAHHRVPTPVTVLALPDRFIEHGSNDVLLDECGLSEEKIVSRVAAELEADGEKPLDEISLTIDDEQLQVAIRAIRELSLPEDLSHWVRQYCAVGAREEFLWKWCLEGVNLTCLSCVDVEFQEVNNVTKVLGVMLDVLLDDVADQSGNAEYLEQLLKIPYAERPPEFGLFSSDQQAYARTTCRLWGTILTRAQTYPRYEEFEELLRFDYMQLLNTMRYSHMINRDPQLLNLVEHDLYLPHNMHMMISGTMDLMCSPGFDRTELGIIREVLWLAQCMGRVGNLVTTWERELHEADFTSGVFARAVQQGVLTPQQLARADPDEIREAIQTSGCERYFLRQWHQHRKRITALACRTRSVDVNQLAGGLEKLITIHLGSRGLK